MFGTHWPRFLYTYIVGTALFSPEDSNEKAREDMRGQACSTLGTYPTVVCFADAFLKMSRYGCT